MVVPPPYDPVLLREHAFYETGIKSLVLPPESQEDKFASVAVKGLGLFKYALAKDFELEKISYTFTIYDCILNLLWISLSFSIVYLIVNARGKIPKLSRRAKRSHMIMDTTTTTITSKMESTTTVAAELLAPFVYRTQSDAIDIEAQELEATNESYNLFDIPELSHSLTNTPKTPESLMHYMEMERNFVPARSLTFEHSSRKYQSAQS